MTSGASVRLPALLKRLYFERCRAYLIGVISTEALTEFGAHELVLHHEYAMS